MQPILEINDLKAYYKTRVGIVKAVDGVSLTVGKGEILGIAGESGCGKSTLAKAVLKLLRPPGYIESGKILFKGTDLLSLDEEGVRKIRWRQLSYIPQGSMNSLSPVTRIEDQVIDAALEHEDWPKDKARQRALELLKVVGLPERCARMYPFELSGGMRQRVVIAISMILEPELIIVDEPVTALDLVTQKAILQLISELRDKLGASIMFITHDMAVHAELVDRLAVIYAGKVVEVGDVQDFFKKPLHPYSEALRSSITSIEEKKELATLSGGPPSLLNPPTGCRFHPRCPRAMEKCSREEPILRELTPEYLVACYLYGR